VQAAAQAIGQQLVVVDARGDRDIETAFATFVQREAGALFAGTGAFLNSRRERVVALAARHTSDGMEALDLARKHRPDSAGSLRSRSDQVAQGRP